jgi:hypothetical protein
MNRDIKFGCSALGKYATIKINAKIDDENLDILRNRYKDWLEFYYNGKQGIRIEGVLPVSHTDVFLGHDLKLAILKSKAERLNKDMLDVQEAYGTCWTKANLDEI